MLKNVAANLRMNIYFIIISRLNNIFAITIIIEPLTKIYNLHTHTAGKKWFIGLCHFFDLAISWLALFNKIVNEVPGGEEDPPVENQDEYQRNKKCCGCGKYLIRHLLTNL